MPQCSVILVTYNSAASIIPCLEALAGENCEIIVVDNASDDNTVAKVQAFAEQHPVQLIRISRNLGFAAGVNHGAKAADGEVLLILNPDAVAEPRAVNALLQCMASTGAAAAGGALLKDDGEPQRGFVFRRLPTLTSMVFEAVLINQLWPTNPVNRRYRCLRADYSRQQEVEQPAGACMAITRAAWDAVAGFDPSFYPVWFEDVDLCQRLRAGGYKIVYCPGARFHHSGAHSVGKLPFLQKQLYWYANMLRYARKQFPGWKVLILRLAVVKGMMLRYAATVFGQTPAGLSPQEARSAYLAVARQALSRL
jgi:GT2 family glycosyltransferase